MFEIMSDCFGGKFRKLETKLENEKEAIKKFAYLRLAYPTATVSLLRDGYIVSTKELSELAKHIILD